MCIYCERRQDVKFGWAQPKLPYHENSPFGTDLSGNVLDNESWNGVIHDYQTSTPELILTCPGYFNGEGVGTIIIPIKYCPECGRKLGKPHSEKPTLRELLTYRNPDDASFIEISKLQKKSSDTQTLWQGKISDCPDEILNLEISAWMRKYGIFIVE